MRPLLTAMLLALLTTSSAAPLTDFTRNVGKYHFDAKLFTLPVFKARVTALVGKENYALLQRNISVSSPITLDPTRTIFYLSGNRPHLAPTDKALIIYDNKRDALLIYLKANHKVMTFEEDRFVNPNYFTDDLRATIKLFYEN